VDFTNSVDGINSALTAILHLRDCSIDDVHYDCGLSDSLKRYFYGIRCSDAFSDSAIDSELLELVTLGSHEVSVDTNGSIDGRDDQWSNCMHLQGHPHSTSSDVTGYLPPPPYAVHQGLSRYNTFSSASVGQIAPSSKYSVYSHPTDSSTPAADPQRPSSSRYMMYLPSTDVSFTPPPFPMNATDQQITYGYNPAGNQSFHHHRRAPMQHQYPIEYVPSQQQSSHYRPCDATQSHPMSSSGHQPFNQRHNRTGR